MIYGRVIGNELRDVPPECLPVWGQRWAGYRAPHGPSPFSTRVFSANGMSEIGPTLTSPTQFEMTLTDEDDGEDTNSESNHFYSSFYPSPRATHASATELTSRPETPTPQSVHILSNRAHCVPSVMQRSTGRPPPPSSTCLSSTPVPQPGPLGIRHYSLGPSFPLPLPQFRTPNQQGHGPRENDFGLRDTSRMSTNSQFEVDPYCASLVPSGQLQHTVPPHLAPEWQFSNAQMHPHPSLPNHSSDSYSDYLLHAFPDDNQARFIPAMPPSSLHSFRMSSGRQNTGADTFWDHDSSPTRIPGSMDPRHFMMMQWQSVPSDSELHSESVESSLALAWPLRHSIPDHGNLSHPEDLLHACPLEGCMSTPLGEPGNDQFDR